MTDKIIKLLMEQEKLVRLQTGALDEVARIIEPGILTDKIDKLCFEFINDNGAYSAPLFYRGYPKSCCTSANHIVCHKYLKIRF